MNPLQQDHLSSVRKALNRNDLSAAAAALAEYRDAATDPLQYNRAYLQLFNELVIKERRSAQSSAVRA